MGSLLKTSGTSSPKSRKIKATWSHANHEIFVDVCLEETLKGNKPGPFFNKEGWTNVEEFFYRKSGLRYDRKQLKNHWDVTKEQWKVWSKLIGTSSMGWDPNTRTFAASEEDWADYIQDNPESAQFRFRELVLADKLSSIFDGTANCGETQAIAQPLQQRRGSDSSTTTPILPMKEFAVVTPAECRTKRMHDKFNFKFDGAANTGETRTISRPGQRRRVSDSSTTTPSLPRNELVEANNAVESRSMVTAQYSVNKLSYSIGECIDCLDGMVEIEQGSDLYMFALDIFLKKEYREVFLQLKKPNVKVAWLKRMHTAGPPLPLH